MSAVAYDLTRSAYHRIKRAVGSVNGVNHDLRPDVRIKTKRFGTFYGGWVIAPDALLSSVPLVYSFGLGEDISFDLAMIEDYSATVHGFDPTPTRSDWGNRSDLPPQFHFHDIGLADRDGTMLFGAPTAIGHDDYTVLRGQSENALTLKVARLETLMRDLGHQHIDVLKMDIEGAEFDALSDIMASQARPTQLLIEFHYLDNHAALKSTCAVVDALRRNGYCIFYVAPLGREISFIHRDALNTGNRVRLP